MSAPTCPNHPDTVTESVAEGWYCAYCQAVVYAHAEPTRVAPRAKSAEQTPPGKAELGADKLAAAGKLDKALKGYLEALQDAPEERRLHQKLAELYLKLGQHPRAGDHYLYLADCLANDGFALKAVSLYKQVLKLDADRYEVHLRLADQYQGMGLAQDAAAQLELLSERYAAAGDQEGLAAVLERAVTADPDNVANRVRLAELYAARNDLVPALEQLRGAAAFLQRNNRFEEFVKVAERITYLDPSDITLMRQLAQIHLALGDAKRALAKLQVCFKADPQDPDTLDLLGRAFAELGQNAKAVNVYRELERVQDERGDVDAARAAGERAAELESAG